MERRNDKTIRGSVWKVQFLKIRGSKEKKEENRDEEIKDIK